MPSYHFDCGNSTEGPIGLCASVTADTPEEALTQLQNFLAACQEVSLTKHAAVDDAPGLNYCNVYIEGENITLAHIDEEDDEDDDVE